jgi:uncharacterized protein
VRKLGEDAYNRIIYPSIEREIRNLLTEKAAVSAILSVLRQSRGELRPPLRAKTALGLDRDTEQAAGFVVDPTGRVLDTGVIRSHTLIAASTGLGVL